MKYTPRQPKTNVNVTPWSPLREFSVLTGGLAVIMAVLYLLLGMAVDLVVPRLSVDFEHKMAGGLVDRFVKNPPLNSEQQSWVQELADRLQTRCTELPYQFQIHVSAAPQVNALAFPGGHIVVFQGLLDQVGSENELAYILAHEMGHYAHRDHLRGLGRAMVFIAMATLLFGPDSSVAGFLGNTLGMTELGFSRQQETAADEFGLKTLNCLYGHVNGSTDFFIKIPQSQDPGQWGHYFASHPANARRIAHLKSLARQWGYANGATRALPGFWHGPQNPSGSKPDGS